MHKRKRWIWIGVIVLVIIVLVGGYLYCTHYQKKGPSVTAFPINTADVITSWDFKGAYAGNATLVSKTNDDINNLKSELGKGKYDDYDIYIGIGNDYELLGDGKDAYNAYNEAIAIHPTDYGLAYDDLGVLMNKIGANYTAADAYAKAVAAQPAQMQFSLDRLTFLTTYLPKNTALIQAALSDASKQFGDAAPVLVIEGQWLEKEGKYADAITAFQTAIKLSPHTDTSNIQAEINRIKAKEAQQ